MQVEREGVREGEREKYRLSRRKDEGGGRGMRDGGDEDEDSWKVRSPWRVILSLLLEGHSLSLSPSLSVLLHYYHHSLCIFLCGIMRKLVAKIYINASSVLDLAYDLSLYLAFRSSSWIATRDNFPISGRFLVAHMKWNLFFFFLKSF